MLTYLNSTSMDDEMELDVDSIIKRLLSGIYLVYVPILSYAHQVNFWLL